MSESKLIHRFARILAVLLASGGWIAILWWGLGRVLNDRWVWSQWMFWTPGMAVVVASGLFFGLGKIVRAGADRGRDTPRRRRRAIPWLAWLTVAIWTVAVESRLWVVPARAVLGRPASEVTVVCWNSTDARGSDLVGLVGSQGAGVLIVTNPPPGVAWPLVVEAMGPDASTAGLGRAKVVAAGEIIRHGSVALGMDARVNSSREATRYPDHGWAGFFELDTEESLGRATVFWIIDLPSDPSIPRAQMLRQAATAIRAWDGVEVVRADGQRQEAGADSRGFPEPDVVIGDFNTPRGSRSLVQLTSGLHNAWSDAGLGGGCGWVGAIREGERFSTSTRRFSRPTCGAVSTI